MKKRFVAAVAVSALLMTACGSRLDEDRLGAGAGTGGGGGTVPTAGGGVAAEPADEGDMFGTLPSPCGPLEGERVPAPTGTPGVSDDEIRIGVISDKAGAVKVPTVSVEESMRAFVGWCNEMGGIDGRTLVLETYDAKLAAGDEAAREACAADLFALVGTGAVMDDKIAPVAVDCGLLNVPAYTATAMMALSDDMVAPLPNPSTHYNTGPSSWMAEQHPEAIEKAAILATDLPTATIQSDRIQKAFGESGFEWIYTKNTGLIMTSYSAEVAEMKAKGVEYVTAVSTTSETNKLLKDMKTAGFAPAVIDLGQQYYDTELLTEPGAEGAYVLTNTMPFEDTDSVPALQQFRAAYDAIDTDVEAATLGVQAFSAGLLFATATKAAGDDLTRANVLAELKAIHEWDGGGLHFTSDPGANGAARCFAYMQVRDGAFVRAFPEEPGTFECPEGDVVFDLGSDYGGGAKRGS